MGFNIGFVGISMGLMGSNMGLLEFQYSKRNRKGIHRIRTAKMSLPISAIFCTSFCISCQIQQLQHLSIAAAPFPNQDWGTIPAEHNEEENQRPQLRWDSLLAPAHQQVMSPRGCKL